MKVAQSATLAIMATLHVSPTISFVKRRIIMIIIAMIGPIMLIHGLIMYDMATNSVLINIFARNINSKPFITTIVGSWLKLSDSRL